MINKVTLLGRVGRKDFRVTKNGTNLCQVSLATSKRYLDSHAAQRNVTTWHNVSCFNKLADIADKYLNVGDLVYLEGEISNRKIEENGVSRIVSSVIASELKFIPTGKKHSDEKSEENSMNEGTAELHDDGIPF